MKTTIQYSIQKICFARNELMLSTETLYNYSRLGLIRTDYVEIVCTRVIKISDKVNGQATKIVRVSK